VILDETTLNKPQIDYPTQWGFKLIGRDKDSLRKAIKDVLGDKEHTCYLGNRSRTGKFHTYNASCVVDHREERDRIFKAFQDHDDIEMVI